MNPNDRAEDLKKTGSPNWQGFVKDQEEWQSNVGKVKSHL